MRRNILNMIILMLFCMSIYAGGIVPAKYDANAPKWVEGEILVRFKDNVKISKRTEKGQLKTGIKSIDDLYRKWQISDMEKLFINEEKRSEQISITSYKKEEKLVPQLFNIYKLKTSSGTDIKKAVEELSRNNNIEYAEPNYIARIAVNPNDEYFSNQWGLHNTGQYHLPDADIDAPEAWEIETGDSTLIIAIIDTGIDYGHPDLMNKIVSTGYDFVNNDNDAMDDNGHGSHVAGIAAASTNNGIGIAGVAWDCKLLPVKVLSANGYGAFSDVANGIIYAANQNASVINLSLGSYNDSYVIRDAIENAYTTSVIVAAAGNENNEYDSTTGNAFFPAALSFVIGVGASDVLFDDIHDIWYESKALFSNWGINADIYAPGVNIYSTIPLFHPHRYSYTAWNGTSMASPYVAGAVALLQSHYPDWSNELIFGQIINTTDQLINITNPIDFYKRLNVFNSLNNIPEPSLNLISSNILDNSAPCDNDGIADAGETVNLIFDVQNQWGQANNVIVKLKYHSYEDTCFVSIIDSLSNFGGISPNAHKTNESNPFVFKVKNSTPNNTEVYFDYEITCDRGYVFSGTFHIKTQRGTEISGIISEEFCSRYIVRQD
ncbi:MAG TPA: S8 family peptidase, partial [Candidatus Cloacimonadota bacterium]|nr:S8 family peptidase [Candidatus Cloacimonadota bacterium]